MNTKGTVDDIPKPLANFLNYIDSGEVTDEYTKELDETVIEVRKDERWKKKMMTVEELMNAMAKKERNEALTERKAVEIQTMNEVVSEGLITKEVADSIIAKLTANSEK